MGTPRHILVVDDERDLCELVSYNLTKAGFDVATAHSGRQALQQLSARAPDLVILDVMLPELSGTEIASRIRSNPATASIPILMLTAKTDEVDQIVGLTVGADDYVTKPFSMKVLLARVEAILRRSTRPGADRKRLVLGPIEIDIETHETFVDGEPTRLTLTEFRLMTALLQAGNKVLSRASLMGKAMGSGVTVTERTIDVHITSIRKKLGDHAGIIRTIRGVGYRASLDAAGPDEDAEG